MTDNREQPAPGAPREEAAAAAAGAPGATAALVCGICGVALFTVLLPILAIVQGRRARRLIDSDPARWTGRGKATAGLALGIAGLAKDVVLLVCVLLSFMMLFRPKPAPRPVRRHVGSAEQAPARTRFGAGSTVQPAMAVNFAGPVYVVAVVDDSSAAGRHAELAERGEPALAAGPGDRINGRWIRAVLADAIVVEDSSGLDTIRVGETVFPASR